MWFLIVKQLSCNKIEAFFAHLYIFSFFLTVLMYHTVKGKEANVLLALYHRVCSPGQMHCWCIWGVKAQGEDSQPVFNIAVESVVQRPGSADCNHHRTRCVVQASSLQTNGAGYWEQILRKIRQVQVWYRRTYGATLERIQHWQSSDSSSSNQRDGCLLRACSTEPSEFCCSGASLTGG